MSWRDKLWGACNYLANMTVDMTANALNVVGSLSCMAGGAAFAVSYVIDGTLRGSYYGSANTNGELIVGITLPELNWGINESVPFQHLLQKNGELNYHARDYFNPNTIRAFSALFTLSGTTLKALSANIKQWRQGRIDRQYLKEHFGVDDFKPPSWGEYGDVSAESLCSSISYAMLSCALTGGVLAYSPLSRTIQEFTYPSEGERPKDSLYYKGPTDSTLVPVELQIARNVTVELPIIRIDLLVHETADAEAIANTTYGGGLVFEANNADFPVAVPMILGTSSHICGTFFRNRARHAREERIVDARQMNYKLLCQA